MNFEDVVFRYTLLETIRKMEASAPDKQRCWKIMLEGADMVRNMGSHAVEGLIQLLQDTDEKIVVMAMIYLGMLHESGINATRAIEPIRQVASNTTSLYVKALGLMAMAMLGDNGTMKLEADFMKEEGIRSIHDYHRNVITTAMEFIAMK